MKIAVFQMTSGVDPVVNGDALVAAVAEAAAQGAVMLFTPEMSGLLDSDGKRAAQSVVYEAEDAVLRRVRAAAKASGIWVHIGSLAVRSDVDTRWANRAFVIDSDGEIVARYDKIHLFDVDLATGESWRESARYVPGAGASVVETPLGRLGLAICYDMRFPALFQRLSGAGATVIAIPAAFTVPTGQAHWHVLLRARAIENAAFVVAAAQVGAHEDGRNTYGHSLVIDPWGRVLLDMGETPGLGFAEIDPASLDEVRNRVPVLRHRRPIPEVVGA
jgi:predicted amidohydrolase